MSINVFSDVITNDRSDAIDLKIDSSLTIELKNILLNKTYLNAFASHLSEEFCIEILTSYIEFTQFQNALISNDKVDAKNMEKEVVLFGDFIPLSNLLQKQSNDEIKRKIRQCPSTPDRSRRFSRYQHKVTETTTKEDMNMITFHGDAPSKIINIYKDIGSDGNRNEEKETEIIMRENVEELIDFKHKVHELWMKYIDISSPFEINISGEDRALLAECLGDCDKLISNTEIGYDALFGLIEVARIKMEQILMDKMERFNINDNLYEYE